MNPAENQEESMALVQALSAWLDSQQVSYVVAVPAMMLLAGSAIGASSRDKKQMLSTATKFLTQGSEVGWKLR